MCFGLWKAELLENHWFYLRATAAAADLTYCDGDGDGDNDGDGDSDGDNDGDSTNDARGL